jgi:hypothetical protein
VSVVSLSSDHSYSASRLLMRPQLRRYGWADEEMKLRPATSADTSFLRQLHHRVYRDVVTRRFGCWNENAQDDWFERGLGPANGQVSRLEPTPTALRRALGGRDGINREAGRVGMALPPANGGVARANSPFFSLAAGPPRPACRDGN